MGETTAPLYNATSFIEQQFPVIKVSMESYAERRANQGQSITSLGKWWGRKPLILVRSALLGLLMPASENPEKDREIFLKILTMDDEGLFLRKSKPIPQTRLIEELQGLSASQKKRYLDPKDPEKLKKLSKEEKAELQKIVFGRMSRDEKLSFCDRPEHVENLPAETWVEINAHLGTKANALPELVRELGEKRFGHIPRVGDAFCGGGSIPFESARLGCDVYAADLNPVASLLTWAALNVVGSQDFEEIENSQRTVYETVDKQILEWGIESNSLGWRADAYLYCTEVVDPESGWLVPLAPSWVIAPNTKTIARLVPIEKQKRYDIEIVENVSEDEFEIAQRGTIKDSRIVHPRGKSPGALIDSVRREMRPWEFGDITPRPDDVFKERLYCIRWEETYIDEKGGENTCRHYRSITIEDQHREEKILRLLQERLDTWREKGYIPTRKIESGEKTDEPIRTRGWTFWHHLFTPRQLLIIGLLQEQSAKVKDTKGQAVNLLAIGRYADWNSKLCRWGTGAARQSIAQTFSNQALNTLLSFASKAYRLSSGTWFIDSKENMPPFKSKVVPIDCRQTQDTCDVWITDPPYADAINYHELTEYFLAWYEKRLVEIFPNWYSDSKRALAVKGSDIDFRRAMIDCYKQLTDKMPLSGLQIVMFTHQEPAVWAELTLTLWAAGLRVTAAWTIQTEREAAGTREGNYVQGTVLLVLRKRTESEPVFLDEVNQKVEAEVRRQLDEMTKLEDNSDPNFGDSDYQLAAYAAALRVLTSQPIEEINPEREILRERRSGEANPIEDLIRRAVKIACDHLIPRNLDAYVWKELDSMERFYMKGLEVESHGEYRSGVYQELARGFGATEYRELLESTKANETRLKSASEFGKRNLSGDGFGGSLVRQCLFAVFHTAKTEDPREGLNYLKTELSDYWIKRERIIHILDYLAALRGVTGMEHWQKDAHAASLLTGMVRNDHV